jgi:uncharacterized membrane protein
VIRHLLKLLGNIGPESRCVLAVGLLVGLVVIAFVPPIVTFDGPSHFFRAEQISHGQLRSTRYSDTRMGGDIPQNDSRFVHTLWTSYWNKNLFLTNAEWSTIAKEAVGGDGEVREEFTNTAVYSPANYVPQSVGMIMSRIFTKSPLWMHRAACGVNLLSYLLLVVLTLEAIPSFKSSILLISTSPLLLIEAATENIDGLNFAIPLLIFALAWKIWSEPAGDHRVALLMVTALSGYTALLKPTELASLGFLFFLPNTCFGSAPRRAAWLVSTFAVAISFWLLWNARYLDVNIAGWFDPSHPPVSEQKAWFLSHPEHFLRAFQAFIREDFFLRWADFYGNVGGWISFRSFVFLFGLSHWFLAVLLLTPICDGKRDLRWSAVNAAQGVGLLLFIALTLWVSYGIKDTGNIPYLGGRYLFLVVTFFLVAWSSLMNRRAPSLRIWLIAVGVTVNLVGLATILIPTVLRAMG